MISVFGFGFFTGRGILIFRRTRPPRSADTS
jgi:hypothetical protein